LLVSHLPQVEAGNPAATEFVAIIVADNTEGELICLPGQKSERS